MLFNTQSLSIEDIPDNLRDMISSQLFRNGGNVFSVEKGIGNFSEWLESIGFQFTRGSDDYRWDWIAIYR